MSYDSTFTADNWHREADSLSVRNNIRTRRWGMRVTVYLGADAGDYVLSYGLNSTDKQDDANWLKVADIGATWGGGGGGVTEVRSGLHMDGTIGKIGGSLEESPIINGGGNFDFGYTGIVNFTVTQTDYIDLLAFDPDLGTTAELELYSAFGSFKLAASTTGTVNVPVGQLRLNNVLPPSGREFEVAWTGANLWAIPPSLWAGGSGGWGAVSNSDTDVYNFTNAYMIYGVHPTAGNPNGFSFHSGVRSGSLTDQAIFYVGDQQSTLPNNEGKGLWGSAPTVYFEFGTFNLVGTGATDPVILLNSVAAPNATDYIGGDGQWHTAGGGGGVTANNALNATGSNVQLGGPMIQDTTIQGAGFDLFFGVFSTSPLDLFQVYARSIFLNARDPGTGQQGTLNLNTQLQFTTNAANDTVLLQNSIAHASDAIGVIVADRLGASTNTPGNVMRYVGRTSGLAAAGLGIYNTWSIEHTAGTTFEAMRETVAWQSATSLAEYAQYERTLTVNHVATSVETVVTSAAGGILRTLIGKLRLTGIPTSSAGLVAGDVWNNLGILTIV